MPRGAAGRGPPTAARTVFRLNRFGVPPRGQRSPSQAAAALLPPVPPPWQRMEPVWAPGGGGRLWVPRQVPPHCMNPPSEDGVTSAPRPWAPRPDTPHAPGAGTMPPSWGLPGTRAQGDPHCRDPARPETRGRVLAPPRRGAPGPQHELCLRRDPAHLPLTRGRPRPCFGKRLLLLAGCRLLPSALRVNKTLNSHTKPDSCQRPRAARCPLRFTEEETEARGRYVAKADTRWQRTEEETGSHSQGPRPNAEDRSEPPGGMGRAPHTA